MLPPFVLLRLHRGSKEGKTVVEICKDCVSLQLPAVTQISNKSSQALVKMRGNMDRNQRGAILKDRHVVAVALGSSFKCKSCSKHSRGVSTERTQGRLWRQYLKAGLLGFSILFLFIVMVRPDWLPLFSDSETVQLIPPVSHRGNPSTGSVTVFSGSLSNTHRLDLKEEGVPQARPKGGFKDVHKDYLALHQNYNSTVRDSGLGNPLGLSNDIKIFIYDLPSTFNKDWLKDERCSNHLFAAEVAVHQRLLRSPVRTLEPLEADYFFMPVYVSCNFNTTTGFPSLGHARSLLGSAVKLVSRKMPYWNRSKGRDHVFVATHDYGPCFHTMEDIAVSAGIPSFLRNSVILQTFGRTDKHACQANNSITIPPFVQPPLLKPGWLPELQHRDIWAFFRGKMEIHPKNVSGRVYSRGVRSIIWQKFRRDRRFFIKRTRSADYQSEIRRSVFCLCPLGWAPWSPRIVESVIFGCVPVIIADKIALPYSHMINWAQISITVPEKDVSKLGKILDKVTRTNLSTIQHNLWSKKYRQAMLYTDPLTSGDSTWQILELLSRSITKRSHKAVQMM
eukprot:c19808_g1_i1 orf=165-1853(+)